MSRKSQSSFDISDRLKHERGYALVAVLAFMTVLAIIALSAAPNLMQQAQRERELEAISRGEQIADAIKAYVDKSPTHQLPTSFDQLLDGVPSGTKKIHVLRIGSVIDPLSKSGKWKLVTQTSVEMSQFQLAMIQFAGRPVVTTNDNFLKQFATIPQMAVIEGGSSTPTGTGLSDEVEANAPFIGVVSKSSKDSIINYYGISKHNEWIFTPLFR